MRGVVDDALYADQAFLFGAKVFYFLISMGHAADAIWLIVDDIYHLLDLGVDHQIAPFYLVALWALDALELALIFQGFTQALSADNVLAAKDHRLTILVVEGKRALFTTDLDFVFGKLRFKFQILLFNLDHPRALRILNFFYFLIYIFYELSELWSQDLLWLWIETRCVKV